MLLRFHFLKKKKKRIWPNITFSVISYYQKGLGPAGVTSELVWCLWHCRHCMRLLWWTESSASLASGHEIGVITTKDGVRCSHFQKGAQSRVTPHSCPKGQLRLFIKDASMETQRCTRDLILSWRGVKAAWIPRRSAGGHGWEEQCLGYIASINQPALICLDWTLAFQYEVTEVWLFDSEGKTWLFGVCFNFSAESIKINQVHCDKSGRTADSCVPHLKSFIWHGHWENIQIWTNYVSWSFNSYLSSCRFSTLVWWKIRGI